MNATFDANPDAQPIPVATDSRDLIQRREFAAEMRYVLQNINMWRMAHLREHEMMDVARGKAEIENKTRLDGMNELRSQIDRERGQYVTGDEMADSEQILATRIDSLEKNIAARFEAAAATMTARIEANSAALNARTTANEKVIAGTSAGLATLTTRITVACTFIIGLFAVIATIAPFIFRGR